MLNPDLAQAKAMLITLKMNRFPLEYGHLSCRRAAHYDCAAASFLSSVTAAVDAAWCRASCLTYYSKLHCYSLCCGVLAF